MNLRDLSAVERTAVWLDELIDVCRKLGPLSSANPKLVADVTRKAKSLRTSLTSFREFLNNPKGESHDAP